MARSSHMLFFGAQKSPWNLMVLDSTYMKAHMSVGKVAQDVQHLNSLGRQPETAELCFNSRILARTLEGHRLSLIKVL